MLFCYSAIAIEKYGHPCRAVDVTIHLFPKPPYTAGSAQQGSVPHPSQNHPQKKHQKVTLKRSSKTPPSYPHFPLILGKNMVQ